ncbi:MAG: serine/threonine protein kinase [Acidimicrobiales bacterium]|nr:serine/threonine protein kinase [Acidimicrobiales bacterium]
MLRRLGRGGMGVVDLAVDEHGRQVALKRLSLHGTPEEMSRARQRIKREAEVLLRLDHPAIVRLLEVHDDGDDIVLVMEYLPGGNLASRVNEHGPLSTEAVERIRDRLLDALASAHRQGVVHRDIKPANVLFDDGGEAYLVDFGAAVHRDATPGLTATEMVIGTPGFMSPEQARGEPATAASDVFSLGATLAFAATGSGPFGSADPRVLMLRAAAGTTEKLPRTLGVELRRSIESMLAADPARRPTAAEAKGGTDGTRPLRTVAGPRRRRNVSRRTLTAGVVALAVGAAIVAFLVGTSDGSDRKAPTAPPTTLEEAPTTTTEACRDLPYQPCGSAPAPNTDGRKCLPSTADFDGDPENGCEAVDADPPSMVLTDRAKGTIVPADDVDRWERPVSDHRNLLGDGKLTIGLTAPGGSIMRLRVLDESGDELRSGVSSNGEPVEFTLQEPAMFRDDSTTLVVEVSLEPGSAPTAEPYVLTTSGQY